MPLTAFQREVALVLAANRNPESHIAGGAVTNRGESGLRISDDLDVLHDAAESVASSAAADEKPDPTSSDFARLIRHFGSVRGAWPRIS